MIMISFRHVFGVFLFVFVVTPEVLAFVLVPVSTDSLLLQRRTIRRKSNIISLFLAGAGGGKGFGTSKNEEPTKEYPPLSRDEVQQWMGHIPVYAVTDSKGNGHAIQLQNNNPSKTVFYFFLSPLMAEAFLKLLPSNQDDDLTVSGLFLGKIWYEFNLLQGPTTAASDDDGDDDEDEGKDGNEVVEYRLVPDPRDLMTAQTLLEMEIAQSTSGSGKNAKQQQQQFIVKPYNHIPLFGVNNMPMNDNTNPKVKEFLNQMVSSHYLFFSSRNMLDVMDAMKEENAANQQKEDDLIFLHQIMAEMTLTTSSKVDYRNIVLVPPTPIKDGTVSDTVLAEQFENPNSFVCQKFLLPLLKE